MNVSLRFWAGIYAPGWLKKQLGTVTVANSQTGQKAKMIPYWKKGVSKKYWAHYTHIQQALRDHVGENNPLVHGVQISGTMFVYSEPFLHQFSSKFSRKNCLAAGWTAKRDKQMQLHVLAIHKAVWKTVPQLFAFNAYQSVGKDGRVRMDAAYVHTFIKSFRSAFGKPRAVIANHSIREAFIGQHKKKGNLYYYLSRAGAPLYFQTATWDRISVHGAKATEAQKHDALVRVMHWALAMGARGLEVPDGHNLSTSELVLFNTAFQKN